VSSLHIVNKSSFDSPALAQCLELATAVDCIVLIADGVYGALQSNQQLKQYPGQVYAMDIDLLARGIDSSRCHKHIQAISYSQLVELSCEHSTSLNWN